MTLQIALLLVILVITVILFSLERIPADVVGLGVLLTLILTGLLPTQEAFAGFGSDVVIMILGLLILTEALLRTGVVELAGRTLLRYTGSQTNRLLLVIMCASALIGAVMSNTASTAFFIPVVLGIARRARISPSKLLMPLAFSSILSSSVTLVSTSTNILVSGLMTQAGLAPIGMVEMAPVGIPIAVLGVLYMYFIGRRLIPERVPAAANGDNDSAYLTEVVLSKGSALAGKTLAESGLGRDLDLTVVRVVRDKRRYLAPTADLELAEADVLLVEGERDNILQIKNLPGVKIKADAHHADPNLSHEDLGLVEAILLLRSPLIGRTLKSIQFRERYGLQVLGIRRRGETIRRKISQVQLRVGDILLIQGHRAIVSTLDADNTFHILGSLDEKLPNIRRAPLALAGFLGALVLATTELVSLPVAMMLGVLFVFLTGCITPEEAYREVEWKAVILIACMLGLGAAMTHTGAAEFLAAQLVARLSGAGPTWLLTAFFALTVVLTQPMSNQAAAVIVLPIALQTAVHLGLNPRTFAMMIAVAASTSYLTPLEPSCLMVYGPGRYRFSDFLKVGSLLTVLIYVTAILLVPMIWPVAP